MAKKQNSRSAKKSLSKKGSGKGSVKKSAPPKKPSKKDNKNKKSSLKKQARNKNSKTTIGKKPQKTKPEDLAKAKNPKNNKRLKTDFPSEKKVETSRKNLHRITTQVNITKSKQYSDKQTSVFEQRHTTQATRREQHNNQDALLVDNAELNLKSTHPASFIAKQKSKLEELRDALLDQMADVAHDSLRAASENGGGAAFGQHMGDAGSEAYERDFALSLLSQEQDSLYEINEALRRIEMGTYGMCEKSGKPIPKERLEAIPWARYTVECQKNLEKNNIRRNRWESTPQFMDSLESEEETDEEDSEEESRVKNKE